mmetsp:Transcript_58605/g.96745  ORF Transcript_58605/g.96745 Transcript_58605/m.96745 type:complete len:278 (+) Transcript_58605:13-846(+)
MPTGSYSKIKLRRVGFCGADDSVEPRLLRAISLQHHWVEWGVLFREEKRGEPRYASDKWLDKLGAVNSDRLMLLAAHVCSARVDELLRGDGTFVRRLNEEVGFQRVQINATAANGADVSVFADEEGAAKCVECLRRVFATLPQIEFIMQRNGETRPLWERLMVEPPENMSMLYDESMGMGFTSNSWPAPQLEVPFGYAGGISPTNIASQLRQMELSAPGHSFWIDMESSLRTSLKDGRDIFDCNKAMCCVEHVMQSGCVFDIDDSEPPSQRRKITHK